MKQICSALVKAQQDFAPALKTSTNPHFRSKYADLSACVEAVVDSLNANGIMLMQKCHESDTGVIVETVFIHESGEMFDAGKLHVPASKLDAQGYGSALTYARRYSLMAACGIAPEDDDGNATSKRPGKPKLVADASKFEDAARKAASGGVDALAKFHKASSKEPGFVAFWTENGQRFKDAALAADSELSGAM